jgi:hypothetical protein
MVLGLALAGIAPLLAQQAPEQLPVTPVPLLAQTPVASSDFPAFDLEFDGGTVKEFLEQLATACPEPVNVILRSELEDAEIPAMRLRGVTVPAVFEAIAAASRKDYTVSAPSGLRNWTYSHGFRTSDRNPSSESVWVFFREEPPADAPMPSSKERPEVRVLNLGSYLDGRTVEDITTAIRVACEMLGNMEPPGLTYHKETRLLFVRGWPEQLMLVDEVLKQLASAPRLPSPVPQMSEELRKRYGLQPGIRSPTSQPAPQ